MTHVSRSVAAAVLALGALQAAGNRPVGDSEVFAAVPAPGYPEGIATRGNRVYVAGPAAFGLTGPAMVWAYDRESGDLEAQYPITIVNPFIPFRGLSCINFGPDGALYAIEPFVGVIRMHLNAANTQEVYSPFPPPPPTGALPNDLVFDGAGNLYVSDSFQGLIYRVPPGGGAPQVWFQDPRLLGNPGLPFGVNGLRIDKDGQNLYLSVTVRNDFSGAIYKLPLKPHPSAGDLQEFHVYPPPANLTLPPAAPDGIAFGKSGRLYVALAGTSQISVLSPGGQEIAVHNGPARIPGTPDNLPWANPANIAFHDQNEALLVTNHASLVPFDPSLFAVFDVIVGDKGQPLP